MLKRVYRKSGDIENTTGGNAKGVLRAAKRFIAKNQDYYSGYVVWFDKDRYFPSSDVNEKDSLEAKKNVKIFMSEPCVENWLLAHFQSKKSGNATCDLCEQALCKYIPHYKKNKCELLDRHIDKDKIATAILNYPEIGEIPKTYFI